MSFEPQQPTSDRMMTEEPHDGGEHPVVIHSPPTEKPQEHPQVPSGTGQTLPEAEMAKNDNRIWWQNAKPGAAFVLFLASLVLLIQTSIDCTPTSDCKDYLAWGLSCAVLSLTFSLLLFLLLVRRVEAGLDGRGSLMHRALATLLFAIWIPGAGVLTFKAPYVLTGNAYFACWLGFIASGYLFVAFWNIKLPMAAFQDTPRVCLWLILLGSVIELTEASIDCPPDEDCENKPAWALSVGIMSSAISCLTLLVYCVHSTLHKGFLKLVALLLFAMWIPGAGILTFDGPYRNTGNAYFACWGAFLSSGYLFYLCWFPQAEDVSPNQKVTVS